MRRLVTTCVLTSLLVITYPTTRAQRTNEKLKKSAAVSATTQRGVDTIAAAQLKDYLSFIASDEMEGRDTPSRGLDTTAKFIAMNLSRWGFKPAGDNGFLQRIDLTRNRADGGQTRVELNGRVLNQGTDYLPVGGSANISGQLVFAGSGWFIKSKEIDAYKGIDGSGKIAVVFGSPNTPPRGVTRGDFGKPGEGYMNVNDYARKVGVIGIIYVPEFQYLANWDRNRQQILERGTTVVAKFQTPASAPLPSIVVSPEVANSLFSGEKSSATAIFYASISPTPSTTEPFALSASKTVSLNLSAKTETVPTQNVVAIWEGSDPVLKDEYVALGAHYDHVGICAPNGPDPICNGADDDGSGTTALLGMAEALAKAPTRPKRSILFVWHCGEEKGLWGSRYFTEYPTVPLDHIVTQLNIDMIGRSKKEGDTNPRNKDLTGPNDVYLIGSTMMSTELGELVKTVNKAYLNIGYDTRYDDPADPNRFFFRSDHYNYAKKGIPIIFFFDGVHEDYHRPGDSPDKIDYQKMEKITRTVYMTMWELANRPARVKVDKPLPAQLSTN